MSPDRNTDRLTQPYNIAAIRALLRDAFTADDLRRFCQDRPMFRSILSHFGPGFSFEDTIETVIEQCQVQALLPDLLAAIRKCNPRQYNRYSGQLGLAGGGQKVVNLRPLDMTHTFKDRGREVQILREYLADERVRLVSVVGRGGMGKTALVCHVLAKLEEGILPVPGHDRDITIDGILYLSARSTGLGLERIYADVGRMLGEPVASRLTTRWTYGDASLSAKVDYLLEALQGGLYLILLDNLEDVLTAQGDVTEEGLRLFVKCCLTRPSGARLIATSREQMHVPIAALHAARTIALNEGLPQDDATALLCELDPQGWLGLRDLSTDELRQAAQRTEGIPRALELLAGILDRDRTASLSHLLADERLFGKRVVEQLVEEGYRRLKNEERRVMEALAVFERPVKEEAVAYLLRPWFPDLDILAALHHLVSSYFVSANRVTGEYSLHHLDREYAYLQLIDGNEPDVYNRRNLELRAADFYVSIRKPESEWKTIDDLAPHLAEFEHRFRAGNHDDACRILEPIDSDYLHVWGHYARLIELRSRLREQLTDPALQMANLGGLGRACRIMGEFDRAIESFEQALEIACRIGDQRSKGIWLGCLGRVYRSMGKSEQAIERFEAALRTAQSANDRQHESVWLGNLGNAYRDQGKLEQAIKFYENSLDIIREIGAGKKGEDAFLDCLNISDRALKQEAGIRLGSLGITYRALRQVERAIRFLKQAIQIARQIGDQQGEGVRIGSLGNAYRLLGQFGQAAECYKEALDISGRIGDRWAETARLGNIGTLCRAQGQIKQATKYYEQALAIDREIGDLRGESNRLGNLALIYYSLRQFNRATEHYEDALAIAREIGDRRGQSYCLLGLGKIMLATGNLEEAHSHCHEARGLNVLQTSYQAALTLGTVLLQERNVDAREAFADAVARC